MAGMNFQFPFQRPLLPPPEAWLADLETAYQRRWYSNFGVLADALEARLARRCGRTVVVTASGTAALTAGLLSLHRSGSVVLPSFTFPATFMAVLAAGCTPVLADVDPATWEIGPERIEALMRHLPAMPVAVLCLRPFGLCRDQGELQEWCERRGIALLIDAAAALGGEIPGGAPVGGQGEMEVFSLHATKVFAVGEGGAIATRPDRAEQLRSILNFGLDGGVPVRIGLNGKFSEFSAAVGLAQDRRFDEALRVRRRVAARYDQFFADQWPNWQRPVAPGAPPWQAYPLLAPTPAAREAVERAAAEHSIQLRRYYHPALHATEIGAPFAPQARLPVSEALAERMLCFPLYSDMSAAEQDELFDRLEAIATAGFTHL